MITVSQLNLHPIKSCKAISVERFAFDKHGPVNDRRWLIVTQSGKAVTQRDTPKLAMISAIPNGKHSLTLSFEDQSLPTIQTSIDEQKSPNVETDIWGTPCAGKDAGDDVADLLSSFLKKTVRLIGTASNYHRPIKKKPSATVSFADTYPLLITSEASLARLNESLPEPIPMNRFRPNIVLQGCLPFEEDKWERIQIGDIVLEARGNCERCIMTTVDQITGERTGKEPLATLTKLRKDISRKPIFGQNFLHETYDKEIERGMSVSVIN